MLWRTGFLGRPLTRLRIHIPSLTFETVVWIISSRCVLELKYSKAGIPIFFHVKHVHEGRFPWWQQRLVYQWVTLLRGSSDRAFIFLYLWHEQESLNTWFCCAGIVYVYRTIYWQWNNQIQKGHAARAPFKRRWCLRQKALWASSHVLGGQYLMNQK